MKVMVERKPRGKERERGLERAGPGEGECVHVDARTARWSTRHRRSPRHPPPPRPPPSPAPYTQAMHGTTGVSPATHAHTARVNADVADGLGVDRAEDDRLKASRAWPRSHPRHLSQQDLASVVSAALGQVQRGAAVHVPVPHGR